PAPDVSARVAQLKNDAQTAAEELSTLGEEQRRHVLRIATEALRPTHEFIQLLAPVGQPESATADRGTAISDLLIPALQVLRNEARMALAQPQTDPTVVPENVADKAREYHQLAKDWARQHGLTEVTAPETDVVKLRSSLTAHVAFLKKRAEVATSTLDVVARPGQSAWARDMAREALLYQRSFVQQVEDVMSPDRTEARRTWAMDEIIKPGLELVAATLFQTRQGGAEWLGHPDALPAPVADVVQQVDALVRAWAANNGMHPAQGGIRLPLRGGAPGGGRLRRLFRGFGRRNAEASSSQVPEQPVLTAQTGPVDVPVVPQRTEIAAGPLATLRGGSQALQHVHLAMGPNQLVVWPRTFLSVWGKPDVYEILRSAGGRPAVGILRGTWPDGEHAVFLYADVNGSITVYDEIGPRGELADPSIFVGA